MHKHNEPLKPTRFLKSTLYTSSILILGIGLFSLFFADWPEILSSVCLVIPFSSFYFRKNVIKLLPSYYIVDLHLFFWLVLTGIMLAKEIPIFFSQIVVIASLGIIFYKRKKNFIRYEQLN